MKLNILIGILLVCTATACSSMPPQSSAQQETDLVKDGYDAMMAEDYATAENLFRQALAMNHLNPYTLLNLGVVYQQTGRYEDARRHHQAADKYGRDTQFQRGLLR